MNRVISVLRGKCPKCEKGNVFSKKGIILLFRTPIMNETCSHCHHKFEIEPGHYIGAMYVSYGLIVGESILLYFILSSLFNSLSIIISLLFFMMFLTSFINFRYSRIIWIYLFTSKQ
jgi:uncharacterized protein (DUF983 family)